MKNTRIIIFLLATAVAFITSTGLCACSYGTTETGTPDIAYEDGTTEADISTPPNLLISYTSGELASAMHVKAAGYSWSWQKNGKTLHAIADALHPLDAPHTYVVKLSECGGQVDILPSGGTVTSVTAWTPDSSYEDGKELFLQGSTLTLLTDQSVAYMVYVEYEAGIAYYTFFSEA